MMTKTTTKSPFPVEVRDRAVRMVLEQQGQHATQWATICSIAGKIGCSGETLRKWVRQVECDRGRHARADFVLDALEHALHERRPIGKRGLIHHSDRGSQYVGIRYTERLAGAGIEPSVGSVGDSYDNALAEMINGLFKAEVIHRQSWRSIEAVELATLHWVDWFNTRRLLQPIGNIPPAEAEAAYYAALEPVPIAA